MAVKSLIKKKKKKKKKVSGSNHFKLFPSYPSPSLHPIDPHLPISISQTSFLIHLSAATE
jgi:hypothetical protein